MASSIGDQKDITIAAYQILSQRFGGNDSALWQVIAISLAAETALWVTQAGTRQDTQSLAAKVAVSLAFLVLGEIVPLTVRFLEIRSMLDRQLLDSYERALDLPEKLRLHHGNRLYDRLNTIYPDLPALAKSRLSRYMVARPSGSSIGRIEHVLIAAGSPSIGLTGIIVLGGIGGFWFTFHDVGLPAWLWVTAGITASLPLPLMSTALVLRK